MRILHVLSANFFAGSVAYAVQLAEAHRAQGHEVWLVSDAAELPTTVAQVQLPVSKRSYRQRMRNIRLLRRLLRQHQVDVVHAHSRAASWISYAAVLGSKVPLVSTVHGRQHLHASTSLFDVYGDKVIVVCDNLKTHLTEEVKMLPGKIVAVPNGISFGEEPVSQALKGAGPVAQLPEHSFSAESLRVALIGRFNGGKGERAAALLAQVFPSLLAEFPALRLALIGGELEHLPAAGKTALAALIQQFGERVEVVGFTDDVRGWLRRSTLIIGAGRVAVEALGAGRQVLALGEACCEGLVTEENYALAAASNFGDISARLAPTTVAYEALLQQARAVFLSPQPVSSALQARVQCAYGMEKVAAEVLTVYQSARMRKLVPGCIPVLMYHKIPDAPLATKHQIYVTKENFEKHLRFFKAEGFMPITFQDYLRFAAGEQDIAAFPTKPIILTFDDGYTDNYTNLLPLMQAYGYRGVLYLLGDFEVRYNKWDADTDPTEARADIMDAAQKAAFVAAGWEIGAHTMSHPHLTDLTPADAAAEIRASKHALEAGLRMTVSTFAYPYGDCNEAVKKAVREAGFSLGVATDTGGLHLEDDRMQVFRVNIFPHETTASLRKKTSRWYRRYFRWKRGK
jgi:peptidoglycan/xylan/chitin deacetylase (PgdA/CDA1 family)/glycosyltransferase involved in cell wall biosynthesis